MGGEFLSRPEKPGFDGSFGASHDLSDFFATELPDVEQREASPIFLPEFVDTSLDFLRPPFLIGGGTQVLPVFGEFEVFFASGSIGQGCSAAIDGDRKEPGMERPCGIPLMETAKGPEEDILNDVFGVLSVAQHTETESEKRVLEKLHELAESGTVSSQATLNQFGFVFGHLNPIVP